MSNNKGIDIQAALAILNERSKCDNDHDHHHPHHNPAANKDQEQYLKLATQGQVIQVYNENKEDEDTPKYKEIDLEEQKKIIEEQQKRNETELKSKLNTMSTKELLQTSLQIQRDRVSTYKTFENGLRAVLNTNNMTSYPLTCTNVTASFSLQSNTINIIKSILTNKTYIKLLSQLQSHEKRKLDYTTAYHLESIRLNHMKDGVGDEEYCKVRDLLENGVGDLKRKIEKCVEVINDVIDEIQCAILEED